TILLVIVTLISYHFSVREIVDNTTFYQQEMLNVLNKELSSQMRSIEETSLAISRNHELLEFLKGEDDPYRKAVSRTKVASHLSTITFSMPMVQSIDLYMDSPPFYDFQQPVRFLAYEELYDEEWYDLIEQSDFVWLGEEQLVTQQG